MPDRLPGRPRSGPIAPDPHRSRSILTDLARASPPQEILDFQKKQEVPANVEKAFRLFDTDRSGDIDQTELRKALQNLGMEADSAQTREVMRKYDRAGRGKLGLDEFNKLVQELLEFQKKQGIGPKDEPYGKGAAKDGALTLPLKIVAFGSATERPTGTARREMATATLELTTTETNLSRQMLPLMNDRGRKVGEVYVSVNAHTALSPFLALRRAFEAADADRDGLLDREEALDAVRGLGLEVSPELFRYHCRTGADAKLDAQLFEGLYARLLEVPEGDLTAASLGRLGGLGGEGYAGPELPPEFRTFLFQKKFPLPLPLDRPCAFWVDAHSSLELLEVRNANLRLLVSAHDDKGELRTHAACLFDGAAYARRSAARTPAPLADCAPPPHARGSHASGPAASWRHSSTSRSTRPCAAGPTGSSPGPSTTSSRCSRAARSSTRRSRRRATPTRTRPRSSCCCGW